MQVTNQQEAALFVYGSFEHLKGWPFKKSVVYIARDGRVYLDMDEAVAAVGNEIVVLPVELYADILRYNGLDINDTQIDRVFVNHERAMNETRQKFIDEAIKELQDGGNFEMVMECLNKHLQPTFFQFTSDSNQRINRFMQNSEKSETVDIKNIGKDFASSMRKQAEYRKSILREESAEDSEHQSGFARAVVKSAGVI